MPTGFDDSIKFRVQQANDIVDVVSEHLSLQRKGKELTGLCPFHDDHKPSLNVSPAKQIFKCYACGAGGDVFKFIQLRENLTFPQALERLAQRAGIKLSQPRKTSLKDQIEPQDIAAVNEWSQKFWQGNLWDEQRGSGVRKYLEQRQISPDSARHWGLGFAPDSWDNLLIAAKGRYSEQLLIQAGLTVERETGGCYDRFRNRLMFPIVDVTGRVIGFGGRTLGDDPAKYLNSPATVLFNKSDCVYGLDKARLEIGKTGVVVVVEGYTDVIIAHQFGCCNVVATLGTSFTTGHARILKRYARRIVLVFDSDTAGIEAANRALEVCLAGQIDIRLCFVPEGKDPCDFILARGKEAFEQVVCESTDAIDYKWQRFNAGLAENENLADKKAIVEEFLRSVAAAIESGKVDPLGQGLIVGKLAGIIGLSAEQINRHLQRVARQVRSPDSRAAAASDSTDFRADSLCARAQQDILEVLLNEPELFARTQGRVTVGDFDKPLLGQIAEVLFDSLGRGERLRLGELSARLESTQAGGLLVELQELGQNKPNTERRLEDAIQTILEYRDRLRRDRIKAGLNKKETESESLSKINRMLSKTNRRSPGITTIS